MNTPIVPIPRVPVTVRLATPADLPFIDSLQKRHAKQVGWMPTKSLEQKVATGSVLVAEEVTGHSSPVTCGGLPEREGPASDKGQVTSDADVRVGYCIATDRYMKREDCGIIYQVNVAPGRQRGLVGAALVKAVFDRAAYGCRLFCCWCAQDIEANRFWESLGFIPLAFRAGSRDKGRVHIFWQRRVRADDATTPYWFPSQTTGGSIREDRLVFPIPPGVHWRDEMPIVLPGAAVKPQSPPPLPEAKNKRRGKVPVPPKPAGTTLGRLQFARPPEPAGASPAAAKPKHERKPAARNDPRLVAAARELRDRYLEHVNTRRIACEGKYDVGRLIGGETMRATISTREPAALPAPASVSASSSAAA